MQEQNHLYCDQKMILIPARSTTYLPTFLTFGKYQLNFFSLRFVSSIEYTRYFPSTELISCADVSQPALRSRFIFFNIERFIKPIFVPGKRDTFDFARISCLVVVLNGLSQDDHLNFIKDGNMDSGEMDNFKLGIVQIEYRTFQDIFLLWFLLRSTHCRSYITISGNRVENYISFIMKNNGDSLTVASANAN